MFTITHVAEITDDIKIINERISYLIVVSDAHGRLVSRDARAPSTRFIKAIKKFLILTIVILRFC